MRNLRAKSVYTCKAYLQNKQNKIYGNSSFILYFIKLRVLQSIALQHSVRHRGKASSSSRDGPQKHSCTTKTNDKKSCMGSYGAKLSKWVILLMRSYVWSEKNFMPQKTAQQHPHLPLPPSKILIVHSWKWPARKRARWKCVNSRWKRLTNHVAWFNSSGRSACRKKLIVSTRDIDFPSWAQ